METISDIVAEMRKRFEPYAKSDSNDARYVAYLGYAEFADRIEAVTKCNQTESVTNCNGLGNAAKMREALGECVELLKTLHTDECGCEDCCEIRAVIEDAQAALSSPPRNCDLYSSEPEAFQAYLKEMEEIPKEKYIYFEPWLFAEANESFNK